MYNMIFGHNELAPLLLGVLEVHPDFFARFRDIWLNADGTEIHVYTRLGGGNREGYEDAWERIRQHPLFVRDFDDDFDYTYATAVFVVPEKYAAECAALSTGELDSGDKRWADFFAALEREKKNGGTGSD